MDNNNQKNNLDIIDTSNILDVLNNNNSNNVTNNDTISNSIVNNDIIDNNVNTNNVIDSGIVNNNIQVDNTVNEIIVNDNNSTIYINNNENIDNIQNTELNNQNNEINNTNGDSLKVVGCFILLIIIGIATFIVPGLLENNKKFTVTFMDLESVYTVQENLNKNSTVAEPESPTKKGYKFLGWYLDDEIYDFNTPIKADLYLKAKWENNDTKEIEKSKNITETVNSNININNNTQSNTSSPVVTPTPVPVETKAPEATTSLETSTTGQTYQITLTNAKFADGTTQKELKKGEKVTIYSTLTIPASKIKYEGNNTCNTAYDVGNNYYKYSNDYHLFWNIGGYKPDTNSIVMKSWDVENPNETSFEYTVDGSVVEISSNIQEWENLLEEYECIQYNATQNGDNYTCNNGDKLDGNICLQLAKDE